ncbi:MAG TPA: hypothetical protein VKA74_04640 [Myxococcota bacterium]|nr:hypothetical protein [Myxococcota bacterium]
MDRDEDDSIAPRSPRRVPRAGATGLAWIGLLSLLWAPCAWSLGGGDDLEHGDPSRRDAAGRHALAFAPLRSIVDVELPWALRVRVRGARAQGLIAPLESRRRDRRIAGSASDPALHRGRPFAIEGHVLLTHGLGRGLEMGVAWSSRSRLSESVGIDLDRHFVGAVFRLER